MSAPVEAFAGVSAFPLTPLRDDAVDTRAFAGLVERLAASGADSITALGSTGSYAYLSAEERADIARLAVRHAHGVPVHIGVGALRTSQVLAHVASAEAAGASGVLLAPMSYQPLTEDDVFGLFRTVSERTQLPIILYDNPATTRFACTPELYARIAELPGVASIKIPGIPGGVDEVRARVDAIRRAIPEHVTIGISGDAYAATALSAGCDAWYSALGGTLPDPIIAIARAALGGRAAEAEELSGRLAPLWALFAEFGGSLRVTAAVAELLGLAPEGCLPLPIRGLEPAQRARVAAALRDLGL
ncbi:dihydrodipicolinate synthase family protein [Leucobacter zeae]|nr:dihydrodipicolinate synthase family protein [Leucobacter zeae]